jgi:molybdopterin molybdotransferase
MLSVQEALQQILTDSSLKQLSSQPVESVPLLQARGRVLAQDQVASVDVPPWDNSAMDGYALFVNKEAADLEKNNSLVISQIIPAGKYPAPLQAGTAARIFTGAPIPSGANAVEMQENTATENDRVTILQAIKPGANIRERGEDIAKGSVIIKAGTILQAQQLGLLASVGIASVPVYQPLRVVVLSTGDELAEPGTSLQDGQIYNSNRYLLLGLLQQFGCEAIDGGMIEDDAQVTQQRLLELSQQGDVIISSGGVSAGDEDHVKKALEAIGKLNLWKIAMKPGKPLAFGSINNAAFFGLPGNPVSAFVTFLLFVKPYLLKAQGIADVAPQLVEAVADFDWPPYDDDQLALPERSRRDRKPLKREEYLRARLHADGKTVTIYPNQSSGTLSSVVWANGLAITPVGSVISRGDRIKFLMV